jgi:hypothetical protein
MPMCSQLFARPNLNIWHAHLLKHVMGNSITSVPFNYGQLGYFAQVRTILWHSIGNNTKAEVVAYEATSLRRPVQLFSGSDA